MSNLVLIEEDSAIATLTLNRPERHNALVPELLAEMLAALDGLKARAELRALILQANGRSFSTGGDVRAFYKHRDDIARYSNEVVGGLNQVILALIAFPTPVIAAVQGIVTGGSLGLVLASDIALLAPIASFTPFYTVVGYSPDGGWTAMLPTVIGAKRAAEILLTNQTINADEAVTWGIANGVVDDVRHEARTIAQNIAQKKWGSVRRAKRLMWDPNGDALAARLDAERAQFVEQIATDEAWQGMADFLEKRTR